MSQVAAILARHRDAGLMTHAWCAHGSLDVPSPTLVERLLPDGRDVFDLASLTKALVTTPLVFDRVKAGQITLDATIGEWMGRDAAALADRLKRMTVKSLLRHETGLPAWRSFWVCHLGVEPAETLQNPVSVRERLIAGLNRAAADMNPSPKSVYSDVGFLLLQLALVATAGGKDLSVQYDAYCRERLGLDNHAQPLAYAPHLGGLGARAIPTAHCAVRGRDLCGEVHDENSASLGGVTAHAGLFGTGEAVARFLHALTKAPAGQLLLEENARARVLPPGEPPNEPLLGWRQGADQAAKPFADGASMGHYGFTGVAFWVCPERRDYAILLTNRVISGRTRPGIAALRREVFTALRPA